MQEVVSPKFSPVFNKFAEDVHIIPPFEKDQHIEDINCPCRPQEDDDDKRMRQIGLSAYIFLVHKHIKEILN